MGNVRKILSNQEGFTLIEIIAVLVILGILAAVAIPKYQSLQTQAQISAAQGAVAAGASALTMAFSQCLLSLGTSPSGTITAAGVIGNCATSLSAGTTVGDFTVTYGGTLPTATIAVAPSGPTWMNAAIAASVGTKTIVFQ